MGLRLLGISAAFAALTMSAPLSASACDKHERALEDVEHTLQDSAAERQRLSPEDHKRAFEAYLQGLQAETARMRAEAERLRDEIEAEIARAMEEADIPAPPAAPTAPVAPKMRTIIRHAILSAEGDLSAVIIAVEEAGALKADACFGEDCALGDAEEVWASEKPAEPEVSKAPKKKAKPSGPEPGWTAI
ncbi:MAG: hypothetical protein AAGC95_16775 [Pseudomonadota bacterium]